MSDTPVEPMFVNLLVRRLVEEAKTKPELEHAVEGTLIRHSDAGGCARKIGLKIAGYEPSNPSDAAGLWVMWLGSYIGEALAEEACNVYGRGCVAEYCVSWDDLSASGHLDLKVDIPDPSYEKGYKRVTVEYKTTGAYGFDLMVGINRKGYSLKKPQGPKLSAKIQGALNAMAAGSDELRIGYIAMEAISKQLAKAVKFNDEQRILAEWSYTPEEYEPWARAERARWAAILKVVDDGRLPDRWYVEDDMTQALANPDVQKPWWGCVYCSHRDICSKFGPGEVAL